MTHLFCGILKSVWESCCKPRRRQKINRKKPCSSSSKVKKKVSASKKCLNRPNLSHDNLIQKFKHQKSTFLNREQTNKFQNRSLTCIWSEEAEALALRMTLSVPLLLSTTYLSTKVFGISRKEYIKKVNQTNKSL